LRRKDFNKNGRLIAPVVITKPSQLISQAGSALPYSNFKLKPPCPFGGGGGHAREPQPEDPW
jgi:hypothetical protein